MAEVDVTKLTPKEQREYRRQRVWYTVDELSIFVVCIVAVVLAGAINQRLQGQRATLDAVWLDPLNLLISLPLSLGAYGFAHSKFRFNDARKPPWWKRATIAVSYALSSTTLTSWGRTIAGG